MYDDEEIIPTAPSEEDYEDIIIACVTHSQNFEEKAQNTTYDSYDEQNNSTIAAITLSEVAETCVRLQRQQSEDTDIVWILNLIRKHGEHRPEDAKPETPIQRVLYKQYTSLRIVNNVLYKETEDEFGRVNLLYVLPARETTNAIETLHASVYGAHLGRRKTKQKTTERFYRPFLAEWVDGYIKTCETCQKIKTLAKKTRAEMQIIKTTRTNQIIASDFAGPFNRTARGNKYIQVISDLYSKYAIIIAQPNKEAITAARAIVDRWCCVFGTPDRCLTDGGKEY